MQNHDLPFMFVSVFTVKPDFSFVHIIKYLNMHYVSVCSLMGRFFDTDFVFLLSVPLYFTKGDLLSLRSNDCAAFICYPS